MIYKKENYVMFDGGFHRRMVQVDGTKRMTQQYYIQSGVDITAPACMDRLRQERQDAATLANELHKCKKICAVEKRFDDARILGRMAKEWEGYVKAATWLLGYCGEGPRVECKDWGHELWPQLDALINLAWLENNRGYV